MLSLLVWLTEIFRLGSSLGNGFWTICTVFVFTAVIAWCALKFSFDDSTVYVLYNTGDGCIDNNLFSICGSTGMFPFWIFAETENNNVIHSQIGITLLL